MNRLLTLQYYFTTRPDPNFQYTKLTLTVVALFLIAAIALKIYQKKFSDDAIFKKITKKYPSTLFNFGLIFIVLLLTREAGIPFLSMRIWWFVAALYFIYWSVSKTLNYSKDYKKRLRKRKLNAKMSKYLPKKKKK